MPVSTLSCAYLTAILRVDTRIEDFSYDVRKVLLVKQVPLSKVVCLFVLHNCRERLLVIMLGIDLKLVLLEITTTARTRQVLLKFKQEVMAHLFGSCLSVAATGVISAQHYLRSLLMWTGQPPKIAYPSARPTLQHFWTET